MNRKLLILGAGMFGMVVKEIAEEMGTFEQISFLDDTFGNVWPMCDSRNNHIGKLEDYLEFPSVYKYAIVSIGDPQIRKKWTKKLKEVGYNIPNIVSPLAYVSPSAQIGAGVVIAPMAVINSNSSVGDGSFITAGAIVDHNSIVRDYCNIQCGSVVMPGAVIGELTKTQPNEVIRNN